MADAIRVLALDHFSSQDRDALMKAGGRRFRWRVIPYWRLRDRANAVLPPEVKEGLVEWARPELEPQRRRYAGWLREELGRIFVESPFDVVVLPSDTYYYVRSLPEPAHELGAPIVVVQKETTITETAMTQHAPEVGSYAPFISDRMTVCSQRHRDFWVASGASPDSIDVTGQPRFDVYVDGPTPRWADVGLDEAPRTVLFLDYERDAYLGVTQRGSGWDALRNQTYSVLARSAQQGWRVLVKPHPLQNWDEVEGRVAGTPNLRLATPETDTRMLIRLSDCVVGFQTTALYEAMVAGKPIAYTGWSDTYERTASGLIPFADRPDLLHVVRSPEELSSWLTDPAPPDDATMARRREFVEEMLGPIDGQASARTLGVIEQVVDDWIATRIGSRRRRDLQRRVVPAGIVAATTALVGSVLWATTRAASTIVRWERLRRAAVYRGDCAQQRLVIAVATLTSVSGRRQRTAGLDPRSGL